MQQEDWPARVVARLRELRRDGVEDFGVAWSWTMGLYPPSGKDAAPGTMALFDERGRRPEAFVPWFRRVCEAAWLDVRGPVGSGNGPAIRHFSVEVVADAVLSPEPMLTAA